MAPLVAQSQSGGRGGTVGVEPERDPSVPREMALYGNYPNPFNPLTIVKYTVGGAEGRGTRDEGRGASVKLVVYDLLGREVATLVDERKASGSYEVGFDARGLASGVYLYRMAAGSYVQSRTMLLLK